LNVLIGVVGDDGFSMNVCLSNPDHLDGGFAGAIALDVRLIPAKTERREPGVERRVLHQEKIETGVRGEPRALTGEGRKVPQRKAKKRGGNAFNCVPASGMSLRG
jgi:hypothetical protein